MHAGDATQKRTVHVATSLTIHGHNNPLLAGPMPGLLSPLGTYMQRLTLDSCDFPAASPLLELRPLASLRHLRLVNCNLDINTLEHVSALAELAASPGLPVLESVMVEDALEFNRLAMEQLNFAVEAGQEALALRGRQGVKFGLKVT